MLSIGEFVPQTRPPTAASLVRADGNVRSPCQASKDATAGQLGARFIRLRDFNIPLMSERSLCDCAPSVALFHVHVRAPSNVAARSLICRVADEANHSKADMKPEVIDISDDEGSGAAAGGSDGSGPGIFSARGVDQGTFIAVSRC